ncbi:MAG: hypothetical protein HYV07_29715 [Deltaproteobacteria bacterium]|nr:hypothetical protein [Deltaproteobacteria bacterium]
MILARATHLDSLVAKLSEPPVRRVLEPLLSGELASDPDATHDEDSSYVRDLGLIADDNPVRVANPIYREVIVRVLATRVEANILLEPRSFVTLDGRLDFDRLLSEFAEFWKANGDILTSGQNYHEVAPQLVIMAFFQRLVNGGGYVDREYGVGRGRIDLLIRWPYMLSGSRLWQKEAVELKVWRSANPLLTGLAQLDEYLTRLGLDRGVLIIFDRRPSAPSITQRTRFESVTSPSGRPIRVLWA